MAVQMAIPVDEKVSKYVQTQAEIEHKTPFEILQVLVQEGYEREVEKLYTLYTQGDITLRGMARRLGVSYRELYQLFEEKGLAF